MFTTRTRVALATVMITTGSSVARADVVLPSLIADGMVLQRDTDAAIWGWSAPREEIRVTPSWATTPAIGFADDRGNWRVEFTTPGGGGPHTIKVQGDTTITLRDVMVGEVWVCSGQSNMEMPLGNFGGGYTGVENWESEVAAAVDPHIRLFTVANRPSTMPRVDCRGSWRACTPDAARGFSATAYFFGRELRRRLNVPVGLISADWGGTVARAWTSADTLRSFPQYDERLAYLREMSDPQARTTVVRDRVRKWWDTLGLGDELINARDVAITTGWRMRLPATMTEWGLDAFDGVVFFQRAFDVPPGSAAGAATLGLGAIDDYDDAWINGRHVGATHAAGQWNQPRSYVVPAGTLRTGRNVITVRVLDTGGRGGMNGDPEQMMLRPMAGPAIALAGEWHVARGKSMSELPPRPLGPDIGPNIATVLYNGMIAPLTNHAIRGAIWYQGESDRGQAAHYHELFPALISDWRRQWGRVDMPFYFVQIAPFDYRGDTGQTAALREAQASALALPATGMAVTLDIGNAVDIHPKNKQDVGRRLAFLALAGTYGLTDVVDSGPRIRSASPEGTALRVQFDDAHGGLELRRTATACFEVAGADGRFVPARAELRGDAVLLSSAVVPRPVSARYAWSAAPEAALFNGEGLPAAPFRTDNVSAP